MLVKKFLSYLKPQLAYVVLLVSFLLNGICMGQTTNTNAGTDFWFSYLDTHDNTAVTDIVNITSSVNTSGTITIPGSSYTKAFTVTAGLVTRDTLPSADVVQTSGFGVSVSQAVNVIANNDISVFASIEYPQRSENTCILPVPLLGNQYYVMDYTPRSGNFTATSEFMIIAQGCPDSVEIIPTATLSSGEPAGVPFKAFLQSGQIYQAQSSGDLTGTSILSLTHSETAVMAGLTWTSVAAPGCGPSSGNPLYEELFPANTWGKNYVFVASPNALDQCRVLAETNGTTVTFYTGAYTSTHTLNAGQYFDTAITNSLPVSISANNPISVGRFLITQDCNNDTYGLGDPSFAILNANEQMFLKSTNFYANNEAGDIDTNYVTVIARTPDVNTVFLDGQSIGSLFVPVGLGPVPYSYAEVGLLQGAHLLTSTGTGFLAYATGMGSEVDATACNAGVYLKNINPVLDTNVSVTITTTPISPPCSGNNATATASASGIPPFLYLWSDGQTTATATGLKAGTYKVIVSDTDCPYRHIDSATVFIAGTGAKVSISTTADSVCSGNPVTISITGGTSYVWTNDNSATTASITVDPTSTTTYSAVIKNGSCGTIDTIITIKVKAVTGGAPNPSFTADTMGNLVTFTNTSIPLSGNGVVFYWDFYGNGIYEDSTVTNPVWLYKDPGTYHVVLKEVDNGDCGGSKNDTVAVVVDCDRTQSQIENYNAYGICAGNPAVFVNISNDVNNIPYRWIFGDPASGSADTAYTTPTSWPGPDNESVSHTYNTPGKYTIWMFPFPAYPCHDTAKLTITVNGPSPISLHNNYVCGDSTVYFTDWDSASGGGYYILTAYNNAGTAVSGIAPYSTVANIPVTFPADTGTYMVIYEAFNMNLCPNFDTTYITLGVPKSPSITGKDTICKGASVLLTASGGAPYTWTWSPSGLAKTDTVTVDPTIKTIYTVTVDTGKCKSTATYTVNVGTPQKISIARDQEDCTTNIITLKANGTGNYLWSPGGATTDSINVTPATGANYSVTIYSDGCSSTASIYARVENPILNPPCCDTVIQLGGSAQLYASGIDMAQYTWTSPTGNIPCSACANITVNPTVTTTYTLTGIDSLGCTLSETVTVMVDITCGNFIIPNVFTPNYAGLMEHDNVFYIATSPDISSWSLIIFDRWGKAIFKTTNPLQYWNGDTEGGSQAAEGVYYYIINATCQEATYKKEGFVQLIR